MSSYYIPKCFSESKLNASPFPSFVLEPSYRSVKKEEEEEEAAHLNMSAPCHCQVSDSAGETCCGSRTPPWREPALTCSSPSPATIPPATCGRSSRRDRASQPKVPVVPERLPGTSPVSTLKVMNVLVWLHVGLEGSGWKYSRLYNTCNNPVTE